MEYDIKIKSIYDSLHPVGREWRTGKTLFWRQLRTGVESIVKSPSKFGPRLRSSTRRQLIVGAVMALILVASRFGQSDLHAGSLASAQPEPLLSTNEADSGIDETATVYIAANVATKLELPMAPEVVKQAETLSEIAVSPLTSQSDKPQIVETDGTTRLAVESYTVQDGDTLRQIAEQFHVRPDTILWANHLDTSDDLKPNLDLKIPPVNGIVYRVQDGDSVQSIADKYDAKAAEIISFNDLDVVHMKNGQQLIIPGGVQPQPVSTVSQSVPIQTLSAAPNFDGNGYDFGWCTWYVKSRRPDIPNRWGDAWMWLSSAQASGFGTGSTPKVGAVAWARGGNHVAYVEAVNQDGTVTVSEMNYQGWDVKSFRTTAASSFMYIY